MRTFRQCGQVLACRTDDGRRPIVYAFAMAFGAGCFMTFITNASFAYIEYFGVSLFLAAVVVLGVHSIWFVVISVAVIVGSFGLAGPAGSSQYVRHFGALAGSASSLYTTLMFGLGSIFGLVSGFFFDGTLRPMALTMLAASVVANGFAMLTGAGIRATTTRNPDGVANAVRAGDRH